MPKRVETSRSWDLCKAKLREVSKILEGAHNHNDTLIKTYLNSGIQILFMSWTPLVCQQMPLRQELTLELMLMNSCVVTKMPRIKSTDLRISAVGTTLIQAMTAGYLVLMQAQKCYIRSIRSLSQLSLLTQSAQSLQAKYLSAASEPSLKVISKRSKSLAILLETLKPWYLQRSSKTTVFIIISTTSWNTLSSSLSLIPKSLRVSGTNTGFKLFLKALCLMYLSYLVNPPPQNRDFLSKSIQDLAFKLEKVDNDQKKGVRKTTGRRGGSQ